jgi:hypothetical protein
MEIAAGDLNGDGAPDLAVPTLIGSVSILLGDGDGSFRQSHAYPAFDGAIFDVALADLTGDDHADVVVTDPAKEEIAVLLGVGDGTFAGGGAFKLSGGAGDLTVADLNGDEHADVVASGNGLSLLFGDGRGSFGSVSRHLEDVAPLGESVVADLDGDRKLDLALANGDSNSLMVLLGRGDGTFDPTLQYKAFSKGEELASGDVDGDGRLDFIMGNILSRTLTEFLNNGDSRFIPRRLSLHKAPTDLALVDLDGDGNADLLATSRDAVTVSRGAGDGTFAPEHAYLAGPPACVVPVLIGVTVVGARRALASAKCRLGHIRRAYSARFAAGRIVSQHPGPYEELPVRASVDVVVSRGRRS